MNNITDRINDYKVEVSCEYKGETYSVRDNGAIMRHSKKNGRIRPLDNQWTFGSKNESNGYMFFASNIRVHQVVATAFWGQNKEEGMVVDHKDTNRCNNRAENLHWVTKLENVLNNPITRWRVRNLCGSIEAFLANPSLLRDSSADSNFKWMRTVSEDEAKKCRKNLERWAAEDNTSENKPKGEGIGEWIFSTQDNFSAKGDKKRMTTGFNVVKKETHYISKPQYEIENIPTPLYYDSLTPNVLQENWSTPTEFLLCPQETLSLESYYDSLEKGKMFCRNTHGDQTIIDFAFSQDRKQLCVATHNLTEGIKDWYRTIIYIKDGKYIHQSGGSYFEEKGALKALTLFQGKEWTGGECMDDYC